jgi:hypothetical protein
MTLDDFRARRNALVARLGSAQADAIMGPGDIEQQFENVRAVADQAETLAGRVYHARLAHQGAAAEASAVRRETDWRPERSIFVETAGQVATRRDVAESELQWLQQRLAGLVFAAHDTGLWDLSDKVRNALEAGSLTAVLEIGGRTKHLK